MFQYLFYFLLPLLNSAAMMAAELSAGLPPTAMTFSTPAAFARESTAAITSTFAVSKWQWVSNRRMATRAPSR